MSPLDIPVGVSCLVVGLAITFWMGWAVVAVRAIDRRERRIRSRVVRERSRARR